MMDETDDLRAKVAKLEVEVEEMRAVSAHLYIALGDAVQQVMLASQVGFAKAFRTPDADDLLGQLRLAAQRLDDRMNQARVLIWKEPSDGAE